MLTVASAMPSNLRKFGGSSRNNHTENRSAHDEHAIERHDDARRPQRQCANSDATATVSAIRLHRPTVRLNSRNPAPLVPRVARNTVMESVDVQTMTVAMDSTRKLENCAPRVASFTSNVTSE